MVEPHKYIKKKPCNNCPYRKDAPLQLWDKSEFIKLKSEDNKQFGAVYGCHKKDGHVCVGWLIKQVEKDLPNINLRLDLSRNNVTREYLDNIGSGVELFETIDEMIEANYPEIK